MRKNQKLFPTFDLSLGGQNQIREDWILQKEGESDGGIIFWALSSLTYTFLTGSGIKKYRMSGKLSAGTSKKNRFSYAHLRYLVPICKARFFYLFLVDSVSSVLHMCHWLKTKFFYTDQYQREQVTLSRVPSTLVCIIHHPVEEIHVWTHTRISEGHGITTIMTMVFHIDTFIKFYLFTYETWILNGHSVRYCPQSILI